MFSIFSKEGKLEDREVELVIRHKMPSMGILTGGNLEDIDYIISDGQLPEEFMKRAQEAEVIIL